MPLTPEDEIVALRRARVPADEDLQIIGERLAELRAGLLPIIEDALRERWPAATATLQLSSVGVPIDGGVGERRVVQWSIRVRPDADMSRAPIGELRLPFDVEPSDAVKGLDRWVWRLPG